MRKVWEQTQEKLQIRGFLVEDKHKNIYAKGMAKSFHLEDQF